MQVSFFVLIHNTKGDDTVWTFEDKVADCMKDIRDRQPDIQEDDNRVMAEAIVRMADAFNIEGYQSVRREGKQC